MMNIKISRMEKMEAWTNEEERCWWQIMDGLGDVFNIPVDDCTLCAALWVRKPSWYSRLSWNQDCEKLFWSCSEENPERKQIQLVLFPAFLYIYIKLTHMKSWWHNALITYEYDTFNLKTTCWSTFVKFQSFLFRRILNVTKTNVHVVFFLTE